MKVTSPYVVRWQALWKEQHYTNLQRQLYCNIFSDFVTNKWVLGLTLQANHESHSRTIESQFKKQQVINWKLCLGLYVTRQIKDRCIVLEITIKTKRNMRRKTTATRTATEITQTRYSTKTSSDRLIDQSLYLTGHLPWTWVRLWEFLCVRDAGCRGNKITVYFIAKQTKKTEILLCFVLKNL